MKSQTMLAPVAERALEQLEAEFLRTPSGFWSIRSDAGLPAVEMAAPAIGCPVDDDEGWATTKYRTQSRGCCG